jgi:ribosomal protein L11 methyltransferase
VDYIELHCKVKPADPYVEIVIARLSEMGYDMFEETEDGVKAYIALDQFSSNYRSAFEDLEISVEFAEKFIPFKNWNEVWENNFEPVVLADKVYIHAAFHPPRPELPYSIIIQPKMAFGTGHHATTSLVMEQMLQIDFKGKAVMDMGCGTGILAILAAMLGAENTTAVDYDAIAAENAEENCVANNCSDILVLHGDALLTKPGAYDILLANINRNIILHDIVVYVKGLRDNGLLILSGFYTDDIPMIADVALSNGLKQESMTEKDRWCCLTFRKAR